MIWIKTVFIMLSLLSANIHGLIASPWPSTLSSSSPPPPRFFSPPARTRPASTTRSAASTRRTRSRSAASTTDLQVGDKKIKYNHESSYSFTVPRLVCMNGSSSHWFRQLDPVSSRPVFTSPAFFKTCSFDRQTDRQTDGRTARRIESESQLKFRRFPFTYDRSNKSARAFKTWHSVNSDRRVPRQLLFRWYAFVATKVPA